MKKHLKVIFGYYLTQLVKFLVFVAIAPFCQIPRCCTYAWRCRSLKAFKIKWSWVWAAYWY